MPNKPGCSLVQAVWFGNFSNHGQEIFRFLLFLLLCKKVLKVYMMWAILPMYNIKTTLPYLKTFIMAKNQIKLNLENYEPSSCNFCYIEYQQNVMNGITIFFINKDYETYYRGEEKQIYYKSVRDNIFQVSHESVI